MSSREKAEALLRGLEGLIEGGAQLTIRETIDLAEVYLKLAMYEAQEGGEGPEWTDGFLASIDPKELERIVLDRDDLHDGLTGPMLQQLREWAAGR